MDDPHTKDSDQISVPIEAIQTIDPQVVKKLPKDTNVLSITPHGSSLWTRTARLDATLHGQPVRYFLKTSSGSLGRGIMSSEFTAMTTIHALQPSLVPRPLAWGTYDTLPDVHFFLCAFRNMLLATTLPDLDTFPALVAGLHRSSGGTAPTGQFGFAVPTYHGNVPIVHGWSDTWEDYFARTTAVLLKQEQEIQGPNEEIQRLSTPLFDKVIPRLLRPLETAPNSITPSLIHGDLWHGNAAMDADMQSPVIFDAASFYAHNEYELAVWRQPWNEIKEPYRTKYCEAFPPSSPEEDFEDRGTLYAIRVNILDSILYKDDKSYRDMFIQSMRELVDKFPGGFGEEA